MNPSAALVVTCMGRAFHLKQTLPNMLKQDYDNYRVVIVDWSSPDDLQDYLATIDDPKLLSTKVLEKQYFSLSGARNAGGDFIANHEFKPDFLVFVDADILLPLDYLKRNLTNKNADSNVFYQRNKTLEGDLGIWGSCIVPTRGWKQVRYNEEISNYGEEDNEFYTYLQSIGYRKDSMDTTGIIIIQHSDELRMQYYQGKALDIPELKRANKRKFRVQPHD